jgi:predicted dehydrogenase
MAQYGTEHGHAAGKVRAMLGHPNVAFAGVYEPDVERRRRLSEQDPYRGVHWFSTAEELLNDSRIKAVASEGRNADSLAQTLALVQAGKHVWYDKPAGEDWPLWQRVVALARENGTLIQMGYMFRYHEGFARIADWARSGLLGRVYAVRAHMSTNISAAQRRRIGVHRGGVFYDLGGHMLDQVVWLLGRPERVTSFLRSDDDRAPGTVDNTIAVLQYEHAMAMVDIAAMEPRPVARRYEVYASEGSAILVEHFESSRRIRLCLNRARDGFQVGEQIVSTAAQSRQELYGLELDAFLAAIKGQRLLDRSFEHELLVQETLLRCTGILS